MTLETGKLKDRVTIQSKIETRDDYGQPIKTWVDVAGVWAWVKFNNGTEYNTGGAQQAETSASIRIRWREDLDTSMRVLFKTKIYNIKAVLPSSDKDYVDLAVNEGLNDG